MTSEVRDELVRALMPELRVLTEHLVKTAVERSLASLLDRQRDLEAKVASSGGASFDKPRDFDAQIQAALAPLFTKQRELEAMLAASRHSEGRPQSPLGGGGTRVPEQPVAAPRGGPPPLPTQAVAQAQVPTTPVAVARPAVGPRPDLLAAAALSSNALVDIPAELNGSRRKRVVVFLLLIVLIGILATVASLSVMSNVGAYP